MMWNTTDEIARAVLQEPWAKECPQDEAFWARVLKWIEENPLRSFLTRFTQQVQAIVGIDPGFPERQILELATQYMVEFLGAHHASVRIYDPQTGQMLAYGSFPFQEGSRERYIPLEGSVAGVAVKTGKPYLVSDLLSEDLYQDKSAVQEQGVNSLMAVPFEIPRFFPRERNTVAVIQIYYEQRHRSFSPLEIEVAEVMARRLSFVFARKKILALYRLNEKKEAIVRKIFLRLGSREGIKMKDVFNRVIPELVDIISIQSCALFSVTEDRQSVILEAGYPETPGYHGIGKLFPIASEPAFERMVNPDDVRVESAFDVVTPSYVLVVDPQRSCILSDNIKRMAAARNINSILYVPLSAEEEAVSHFMTFDALDKRKRYTEEEIEIFLFLGRELMKAQQMERMDDILHDFKNPAIATAGFARRLKGLLDRLPSDCATPEMRQCVEVLLEETSRLQELALSVYGVGREQVVDLTDRLRNRVEINGQAIKEQLKQNVSLQEGPYEVPLYVKCYPLHLERVLDNLLNNATNAIPPRGGMLAVRTYADEEGMACAEITNTGRISEEDQARLMEGQGRGRGLHITHRIVRLLKGKVEVRVDGERTTFLVRLPRHREEGAEDHDRHPA
jgi:signal transduction histidine kinase